MTGQRPHGRWLLAQVGRRAFVRVKRTAHDACCRLAPIAHGPDLDRASILVSGDGLARVLGGRRSGLQGAICLLEGDGHGRNGAVERTWNLALASARAWCLALELTRPSLDRPQPCMVNWDLFTSKFFCKIRIVALSFVFNKYCLIID